MHRATLLKHLAEAERHVRDGEKYLQRQRDMIVDLERDRRLEAAQAARELLAQFEKIQAEFIADRDRLRRQVDELA